MVMSQSPSKKQCLHEEWFLMNGKCLIHIHPSQGSNTFPQEELVIGFIQESLWDRY